MSRLVRNRYFGVHEKEKFVAKEAFCLLTRVDEMVSSLFLIGVESATMRVQAVIKPKREETEMKITTKEKKGSGLRNEKKGSGLRMKKKGQACVIVLIGLLLYTCRHGGLIKYLQADLE
ncbi:MAG: hypothetical protein ABFS45_15440 [Pseudomonadota bacterium]